MTPLLLLSLGLAGQPEVPAAESAREWVERLDPWLESLVERHQLPALSIALVDDQAIVWARGYGLADPARRIPATAETVHRAGSVSKLMTDLAVMRLVEQGKLDLDRPVADFVPEFRPKNPFDAPITLRHLMAHRSGLVREPPRGNYFDPDPIPLADVVRGLEATTLVYPPGAKTKYSNAGLAVVGLAVEHASGRPFPDAVRELVLEPIGMTRSRFRIDPALAKARMWTYHGRAFPAPRFPFGMGPAAELEASVLDLARFIAWINRGGGEVVRPETLAAMFQPQFAEEGKPAPPFGLGFAVGKLGEERKVGHSGAVYGFATDVAALPDEKLGVAVIITRDCANGLAGRIADAALSGLLAKRKGKEFPPLAAPEPIPDAKARELAGLYRSEEGDLRIFPHRDQLVLTGLGPTRRDLALGQEGKIFAGGILGPVDELTVVPGEPGVAIRGRNYRRVEPNRPEEAPKALAGLIGEYGWDHLPLIILEDEGRLYALIEWFFLYPLAAKGDDIFAFPDWGMYQDEAIAFRRGPSGRATEAVAAGIRMPRRVISGEDGGTFKVEPTRTIEELREAALKATPPTQPEGLLPADLVDLATLAPTIKFDIRYATTNNFMGTAFYSRPGAYMQRPAAEALLRAHEKLAKEGFGLLIHDAYRPWAVTKMFWDGVPDQFHGFVADPSKGSKHNRGCAVDLTLYHLETGKPAMMVSGYDEFSDRAYPDYPGGTSAERWRRALLRSAMEAEGFAVDLGEWWHYDFKDWKRYPVLNSSFEQLEH